jgi:hypothetical protein
MNTRGLTELVILNVGLELGLLSQELFTMLVVMALVTTMMTGPLLRRTYPDRRVARDIAEAERANLGGEAAAYRVLVVADPDQSNIGQFDVALALVDSERPAEIVVASLPKQKARRLDVGSGLSDELAAIASSMERLELLVRRGAEHDIPVKISSHLSADPASDVLELARAISPRVVVLGGADDATQRLLAELEVQVVSVAHGDLLLSQSEGFSVAWEEGDADDAAVALGCRLSAFTGTPLHLEAGSGASGRRFAALTKALAVREVDLVDTAPMFAIRVGRLGSAGDITTRPERDPLPVEWATVNLGTPRAADIR